MQQFGNVVTYTRNGVNVNALVLASSQVGQDEHLVLVFLDPKAASSGMSGSAMKAAILQEFGVVPLKENIRNGWFVEEAAAERAPTAEEIAAYTKDYEERRAAMQTISGVSAHFYPGGGTHFQGNAGDAVPVAEPATEHEAESEPNV